MAGRAPALVVGCVWAASLWAVQDGAPGIVLAQPEPHAAELFQTADTCMVCHNGLITPAGEDVSIGADWRASMMANSARDPYWQAAVRREVIDHPEHQAAIEDECSICHMPMSTYPARAAGGTGEVFANLPVGSSDAPTSLLAADGVSCAACHQITPAGLGTAASFTGGYVIDTMRAAGDRQVFGPFEVDPGRTTVMRSASTFVPTTSTHVQSSDLCATCHTLFTQSIGASGDLAGRLPEQTPYLEWQHSDYQADQTCQSCHMPVVAAEMPITGVLGQPREGLSRHVFRGGNFFMMRMLNRYRAELGVAATAWEMDAAIGRTLEHLQRDTARVMVESVVVRNGRLEADVVVRNRAGHKLPTAYPSRRAWIQFVVHDAAGRVVFESGAFRPDGGVEGNDNDEDARRFEPHYATITAADQVQVYESVMVDQAGSPTTGLLTAVGYGKDNRLLPTGFNKRTASPDIAVHGRASDDDDFEAGADRVRYDVGLGGASGPFEVTARLWFQPIGYRWAANLSGYDAFETRRFVRYYESMAGASAVILAEARATTNQP